MFLFIDEFKRELRTKWKYGEVKEINIDEIWELYCHMLDEHGLTEIIP